MTKIIVTGATGFIGRHLIKGIYRSTEREVIELSSKSGDVASKSTWDNLPKVDVVVHLAARCYIDQSWDAVSDFMETNVQGTIEALNYCRRNGSRFVYLSSYLYGNPKTSPVDENAPLAVNNPYSFSKKLAEEACEFYSEYFDVPVTVLRPFNVYGAGQSDTFIVPTLIEQISQGRQIVVKNLNLKRDYLYVNDLVDAILLSLNQNSRYSVYNIGSGRSYTGKQLIDILQMQFGTDLPVSSTSNVTKNEILETRADIRKAMHELSWTPKWSLAEGLNDLIKNSFQN